MTLNVFKKIEVLGVEGKRPGPLKVLRCELQGFFRKKDSHRLFEEARERIRASRAPERIEYLGTIVIDKASPSVDTSKSGPLFPIGSKLFGGLGIKGKAKGGIWSRKAGGFVDYDILKGNRPKLLGLLEILAGTEGDAKSGIWTLLAVDLTTSNIFPSTCKDGDLVPLQPEIRLKEQNQRPRKGGILTGKPKKVEIGNWTIPLPSRRDGPPLKPYEYAQPEIKQPEKPKVDDPDPKNPGHAA